MRCTKYDPDGVAVKHADFFNMGICLKWRSGEI